MATNKPQDDYQKQGVRIPRDLHNRLHEAAASAGRSYNAELVHRLESTFQAPVWTNSASMLDARRANLQSRLDALVAHQFTVKGYLNSMLQRIEAPAFRELDPEMQRAELDELLDASAELNLVETKVDGLRDELAHLDEEPDPGVAAVAEVRRSLDVSKAQMRAERSQNRGVFLARISEIQREVGALIRDRAREAIPVEIRGKPLLLNRDGTTAPAPPGTEAPKTRAKRAVGKLGSVDAVSHYEKVFRERAGEALPPKPPANKGPQPSLNAKKKLR